MALPNLMALSKLEVSSSTARGGASPRLRRASSKARSLLPAPILGLALLVMALLGVLLRTAAPVARFTVPLLPVPE